ncbi:tetratricopeptide repeat protein [Micromonospora maritima]|uniref:Tetratricopeptide repeat protein n=1 Tax=Micromonospora maritima TaxID=986711 RepID=A0ABW7ZJB1_9ACTN
MGPDDRERLFDRARERSTARESWPEADRLWTHVVAAYREAVRGPGRVDPHDRRQLARALWRHGMLLTALGRAAEGLTPGREAVALFEELNDAARAAAGPQRDETLAELITAMLDLAESAHAAGRPALRMDLLDRAVQVGLHTAGPPPSAGPRTREAMGTAYHNQATALLERARTGPSPDPDARAAALAASRACELRQRLLDPNRPLSLWEMANTYGLYAQCLVVVGEVDRARLVLDLGNRFVAVLGPAGEQPAAKLRAAAAMLAQRQGPSGGGRRRRFSPPW